MQVCINIYVKFYNLITVYSVQKKSCKRKLFTDVKGICTFENMINQIKRKYMSHKYILIDVFFTSLDSDSTVSMVAALLPSDDPTVKEFLKYRRILKSTNDKLLRNFYDAALAKLQTAIIRRQYFSSI